MRMNEFSLIIIFLVVVSIVGCDQQQKSAANIIGQSLDFSEREKQVDFLVKEASELMAQERYAQAQEVSEYILTQLDQQSNKAKQILEMTVQRSRENLAEGASTSPQS